MAATTTTTTTTIRQQSYQGLDDARLKVDLYYVA